MELLDLKKELEILEKEQKQNEIKLNTLKESFRPLEKKIYNLKQQINWFGKSPCNFGYYEVRHGKCSYGEVVHGNIHCLHPKCK